MLFQVFSCFHAFSRLSCVFMESLLFSFYYYISVFTTTVAPPMGNIFMAGFSLGVYLEMHLIKKCQQPTWNNWRERTNL